MMNGLDGLHAVHGATPVSSPKGATLSPRTRPSVPLGDADSDEEEPECRVCRGEAEPDRRLFEPCKCSGSIRYTHSDCLEQWLEHSGKAYCELCGHRFEFKPLYDANAPDVLPWTELAATVGHMLVSRWIPFVLRALLVAVLWLGLAPWCTSWLYRMWLLRASAMVNVNFSERFDTEHVTADVFSGIILNVVIIFSFLALMSFADFLRFHLDHIDEAVEEPPFAHHQQHQHPPHPHAPPPRRLQEDDALVQPALQAPRDDQNEPRNRDHRQDPMPFGGVFDDHPREELGFPAVARNEVINGEPDDGLRQRRPIREPVDPVAQPPPAAARNNGPVAPPPRNRPNPVNNNNPNREWEDDFDHMEINIAMDELLGFRGDIVVLFRNVSWLLAFNGAYLGLFAFIPYTLGSTIISAGTKIVLAVPGLPAASALLATELNSPTDDLSIGMFLVRSLSRAIDEAKKRGDCLQLVDLCTCAMGYLSICFTIVLWRWMVTTASSYIHRPLMGGLLWALRCLTAIVKVSSLLLLKMVVLPIVLGLGIDFSTLLLFNASPQDRVLFCMENMVGALLIHWVLGISFMLFITVSVLQLREVLHPDILAKVIRPQEAHPDLLRSLLSETCGKHARRMVLSLLIYAWLLFVLVHVPTRLATWIAPSYFPLTLRFQHYSPEIQTPIELLIVHLIVLGILEQAKNEIGRFQHIGFVHLCRKLGLTEYLLPRVEVTWTPRHGIRGAEYVLAPPPLHFHPQAAVPPDELRIHGHRYLPWPEEGLDDPVPTEYELLVRETPKHLQLRIVGLTVAVWAALVASVGALLFGTFFLGRVCVAPFERFTGITHDPIALAAGVQIVWYMANGLNALNVVTMPEDQVEPVLVERGYCVKNMTPVNAVVSVVGWSFICPFMTGYLVSACFPGANSTWIESFWLGYLLFNLFAWFICCFRGRRNRRRRRDNGGARMEDEIGDELDDFAEDAELDDFPGDFEELDLDDDEDEEHDFVEDMHEDVQDARDGNNGARQDGFLASLRKSYKQIMFNVHVHDNDGIRLRDDNIRDRCFDLEFFMENVLYPAMGVLAAIIFVCSLQSIVLVYVWSSMNSDLPKTGFAISVLAMATSTFLFRSHTLVSEWMTNFAESIRNERYLIGRQLQDMVR